MKVHRDLQDHKEFRDLLVNRANKVSKELRVSPENLLPKVPKVLKV